MMKTLWLPLRAALQSSPSLSLLSTRLVKMREGTGPLAVCAM